MDSDAGAHRTPKIPVFAFIVCSTKDFPIRRVARPPPRTLGRSRPTNAYFERQRLKRGRVVSCATNYLNRSKLVSKRRTDGVNRLENSFALRPASVRTHNHFG